MVGMMVGKRVDMKVLQRGVNLDSLGKNSVAMMEQ